MPTRVRRRLLASSRPVLATAALLPALALTAACGGGGGGGSATTPQGAVASGAVPARKLTQALLTDSDLPDVTVKPAGSSAQMLGGPQKTEPAACQPIADLWSTRPKHPRQVYAGGMVTDTASGQKASKTISLLVIASYKPGEAKAVVDELAAAVRACRNYTVVRNGRTSIFSVLPVPAGPTPPGDQQVGYTIADTSRGAAGIVLVTVVRTGDTTAAYETVRQDHGPATLRAAIPVKQAAKLRAAAAGS
jgi:hypothetical protein